MQFNLIASFSNPYEYSYSITRKQKIYRKEVVMCILQIVINGQIALIRLICIIVYIMFFYGP